MSKKQKWWLELIATLLRLAFILRQGAKMGYLPGRSAPTEDAEQTSS